MKKFLTTFFKYAISLFIFFNIIAFFSLFVLNKSCFYKPQFIKNGVEETKFDYVVLGSSTGLTTLDTKLIDSIATKKGLNISMDDSSLNTHYLMLKHFYTVGKQTEKLVLVITPWDISNAKAKLNNNDYRFLPHINNNYVFEYYNEMEKELFKPLTFSRYIPIIGVSYYNTEIFYPSLITFVDSKKRNRFDDKGNYSYPNLGAPKNKEIEIERLTINNLYYYKIAKFCKSKNIKLITYISPIYRTKVTTNNSNILNHSYLIKSKDFFYDNIHVNSLGRKKCSIEFASSVFK